MTEFAVLRGLTLASVSGMEKGSDRVMFTTDDGREFVMYHREDCCESVQLEDVAGDPAHLIGSPITMAIVSESGESKPSEYADSWTWTFYNLATLKGYVSLRWLGESNGYYSESVDFEETTTQGE